MLFVLDTLRLHLIRHINGLKATTNPIELHPFLGLCNIFRQFVPNLTRMTAPLKTKIQKDQPEIFGSLNEEELKSMKLLKDAFISPPVLALSISTGHINLDTKACDVQVGCMLLQAQHDNKTRHIGYCSRSLTNAERKYNTSQRECLTIVLGRLTFTTIPRRTSVYNPYGSRPLKMDPHPYG